MRLSLVFLMSACILFIFASMMVSALSSTLAATYAPHETIIARIEGVLLAPIQASQVELRREHVVVPWEYDIGQLDTATYFWGIAPSTVGNYTLILKNVQTIVDGSVTVITYMQNFSVLGESALYSVRPGFVSTASDFSFIVESYRDVPQMITIDSPRPHDQAIAPGITTISIPFSSLPRNTIFPISLGRYQIPIFIRGNESGMYQSTTEWSVDPPRLHAVIRTNETLPTYHITATYRGTSNLKNVIVRFNTTLFTVDPSTFTTVKSNQSISFNVTIREPFKGPRTNEIIFGEGNTTYALFVEIELDKKNEVETNRTLNSSLTYCSQLSGIVCRASDVCSEKPLPSQDGLCCLGTCEAPKPVSRSWMGYLLLGILLLIGIFFWIRYAKKPQEKPVTEQHESFEKHP